MCHFCKFYYYLLILKQQKKTVYNDGIGKNRRVRIM